MQHKARFVISLLLMMHGFLSLSQVQTSVTVKNPWKDNLEIANAKYKDIRRKARQLKKQARDSEVAESSLKRSDSTLLKWRSLKDSLTAMRELASKYQVANDSLEPTQKRELVNNYVSTRRSFYTAMVTATSEPDNQTLHHTIREFNAPMQWKEDSSRLLTIDSTNTMVLDSLVNSYSVQDSLLKEALENVIENFAKEQVEGSVGAVEGLLSETPGQSPLSTEIPDVSAQPNRFAKSKNLKQGNHKFSPDLMPSVDEELVSAHAELITRKKKFKSLPSVKDMKSGTPVNALTGTPLWQRVKWGGNIRINGHSGGLTMNFAPSIALMLDRQLSIGTEIVWGGTSEFTWHWLSRLYAETYGVRGFADYIIFKSFFLHGEFENLVVDHTAVSTNENNRVRATGVMAGLGKRYRVSKRLNGKMTIQYNFLHDQADGVYSSPWVIRFGIEIQKQGKNHKNNEQSAD